MLCLAGNMETTDSTLPSKSVQVFDGPIQELPSSVLTKIFSYLPFKDRYLACVVARKWAEASRDPWTDITSLSLNSIPRAMADHILRLCPKLLSIEASDHTVVLQKKKKSLKLESVRRLMFRNVKFAGKGLRPLIRSDAADYDRMESYAVGLIRKYFERYPNLSELTLHDCKATYSPTSPVADESDEDAGSKWYTVKFGLTVQVAEQMAESIQHVVLTRAAANGDGLHIDFLLERAQNLECAYLDGFIIPGAYDCDLPRMRELCLVNSILLTELAEQISEGRFPSLQAFFYASDSCVDPRCLAQLITAKLALRILVIVGKDEMLPFDHSFYDASQQHGLGHLHGIQYPFVLPPRQFATDSADLNQPLLPQLQIFVGGDFTKHVCFSAPKLEVAKFWRIDCPMREYLEKPHVAEVFKDVWLAKIIREGPENGLMPWGSPGNKELFYSTTPLMFH